MPRRTNHREECIGWLASQILFDMLLHYSLVRESVYWIITMQYDKILISSLIKMTTC